MSFSPCKGDCIGREALAAAAEAYAPAAGGRLRSRRPICPSSCSPSPFSTRAWPGPEPWSSRTARRSAVTSGTMAPYWVFEGGASTPRRPISTGSAPLCLAYVDSRLRGGRSPHRRGPRPRRSTAVVVPYHLRSEAPPYARPIVAETVRPARPRPPGEYPRRQANCSPKRWRIRLWRQDECINLIPSEMTTSPMVRLLSVMDPAFRYAEHRAVKAFYGAEVFYYQGVDFIAWKWSTLLAQELGKFLGCAEVEARPHQRADGKHGGLRRAARLPEPRRPRAGAAAAGGRAQSQPRSEAGISARSRWARCATTSPATRARSGPRW